MGFYIPESLITKANAPRTWTAMLNAWNDMLQALVTILTPRGAIGPLVAVANGKGFGGAEGLHMQVWRWMWSLPPCSEARKAAFTLGAAALLIERWRGHVRGTCPRCGSKLPRFECDACQLRFEESEVMPAIEIGQRAESLLRIAAWHVDDARGEAHARTLGREPTIPPHERVYERCLDGRLRIHGRETHPAWPTAATLAQEILIDHANETGRTARVSAPAFADLAIASLPDGPWVMWSQDVARFLELILNDGARPDDEPVTHEAAILSMPTHAGREATRPLCHPSAPEGDR